MKKNFIPVAKEVIETEIKSLTSLKKSINNSFNKVVEKIINCKNGKIIISGSGQQTEFAFVVGGQTETKSSSVPEWVKNNAGWWADGQIPDSAFIDGIEYLIKDGIIVVSNAKQSESQTDGIPEWIKNNAGWWADGRIPDSAFIDGIEYLIKDGIIRIS